MSRIDVTASNQANAWVALSESGSIRRATESYAAPLWARVWDLALTRVDGDGHSQFASGELAELLLVARRTGGELVPATERNARRAVTKLIELEWVCGDSETRCIRFRQRDVHNGIGRHGDCRVHVADSVELARFVPAR